MNAPLAIKGWCPTALRPMMSGDGLLVRVPARHATLRPGALQAIAALASRYGNGLVDLTARANLQIRGVRDEGWPALVQALAALDLLPPGDSRGVAVNVMVSPLAGMDESASFDPRPLADAVEAALLRDPACAALPSKFGFSVDGGGTLPLGDVGADVAVRTSPEDRTHALIQPAGATHAVPVPLEVVADASHRLARAFLGLRKDERRMRALVARAGETAVFAAAGLRSDLRESPQDASGRRALGVFSGTKTRVGLAAPFGAWTAEALNAVASALDGLAAAEVRVTPWRVLLTVGLPVDSAAHVLRTGVAHDLVVSPDDPRLSVQACAGAPACSTATVATRVLARHLAPLLPATGGTALHVSGCAKGCAHPRAAPVTLVGRDGRFDLVADGPAAGSPALAGLDDAGAAHAVRERTAA